MKKILSFAAVALVALSFVSAKGISVGAHGYFGEGWGNTYCENDSSVTKPFGDNLYYGGGGFVSIGLKGAFFVQPEVNYYVNNIGAKSLTTLFGTTTTTVTRYTYNSIDVPLLVGYKYKNFSLLIGPYVSFPVSSITYTSVTSTGSNSATSSGDVSTISGVTYGLTGGLEYESKIGPGRLIFGARYLHDFNPVCHVETDDSGNKSTKNYFYRGAAELTLGYKVSL